MRSPNAGAESPGPAQRGHGAGRRGDRGGHGRAGDDQPATVERALRASELERKRLLDAAKAAKDQDGQAGGPGSSSSNAASRS